MATHVDIVTEFDNRSVMSSANDLKNYLERTGNDAGDKFAQGFERSAPRIQKAYENAYAGVAKSISTVTAAEAELSPVRQRAAREAGDIATKEERLAHFRENLPTLTEAIAAKERELVDLRERHSETIAKLTVRSEALSRAHIAERSAMSDLGHAFRDVQTGASDATSALEGIGRQISGMTANLGALGSAGPAGIAVVAVALVDLVGIASAASGALGLIPAAAGAAAAGIGTVALATAGFSDALKAMGDPKKFGDALAQLSPNAQQAALSIKALMPAFDQLKNATADAFFANLGPQLNQLTSEFLPTIRTMTTGIATAMNQAFSGIATQLMTPETQSAIQQLTTNITKAFQDLAPATAPLTRAFAELANVGSSFLPSLAQAATGAAKAFSDFIDKASKSGDLSKWINEGITTLQQLVPLALDLGKAFLAMAPIGQQVMPDIVKILGSMADLVPVVSKAVTGMGDGFIGLNGAVKIVATTLGTVDDVVKILSGDFSKMGDAVKNAAEVGRTALFNMLGPLKPIFKLLGIDTSVTSATDNAQANLDAATRGFLRGGGGGPGAPGANTPGTPPIPLPGGPGEWWHHSGVPGAEGKGWGGTSFKPSGSKSGSSGSGLPSAPQIPYDSTLPAGFAGVPQTAEIYSAENSYLDARHSLAEKQARLDQLEHDNKAKAEDITKARNDVINAEQAQNQAELRLYDARQSLYDKGLKQSTTLAAGMEQIGVALDKDLGLSKGLPGLADNLVRFLANLAAAPLLGQLSAISQAQGGIGKTGSGLVGIAAAQGAFGPQFTPEGQAQAAAATGPGSSTVAAPAAVLNSDGSVSMVPTGRGRTAPAAPAAAVPAAAVVGSSSVPMVPGSGGRVPYGLPPGSNSGGYGGGGVQFPAWVNQLAADFGIKPSTYAGHQESNRNEAGFAPNPQNLNRAIDWSGPTDAMQRFADYLKTIPQDLEQVIWQNPNTGQRIGIAGGQDVSGTPYYAGDYGGHQNHVHTRQSESIPLPSPGGPNGAMPWPQMPGMAGGGGIDTVPAMLAPGEHVLTRQDVAALGGQSGVYNFRKALHFDEGGDVPHLPPGTQPGQPRPPGPGAGAMASAPGVQYRPPSGGAALGPTQSQIGGKEQPAAPGGGASSGGGLAQLATSAAATAADSFAPGSGAAVQIASQEIQRAIKFGGQLAGIGVGGLMQTLIPFGGSDLANNNWITRVSGAFAGVQPQIPNLAGKSATTDAMQQKTGQPLALPAPISTTTRAAAAPPATQAVAAPPPPQQPQEAQHYARGGAVAAPSVTVHYNNNGATEDRAGADLTSHLRSMYENMPGQR